MATSYIPVAICSKVEFSPGKLRDWEGVEAPLLQEKRLLTGGQQDERKRERQIAQVAQV